MISRIKVLRETVVNIDGVYINPLWQNIIEYIDKILEKL